MASKKIVLTAEEKEISRWIESGKAVPVSKGERVALLAAARRKVIQLHGGRRPGSGRKALGHVATSLALTPAVRAYLTRKAGGKRGMSAVANRIFTRLMEQDRSVTPPSKKSPAGAGAR